MMAKLIIKSILFSIPLLAVIYGVFTQAGGDTDAFYLRFTSKQQQSLILGTSRSAQGIRPEVFQTILGDDVYNYSFTIGRSPYGPVYLESIKKKLDLNTEDGVFILSVDPWSISSKGDDPNDVNKFRELSRCLNKVPFVNIKPNVFYLVNCYSGQYLDIFKNNPNGERVLLHDNGWLEISIPMDSTSIAKRVETKMEMYVKNKKVYRYSNVRKDYLVKTVEFLSNHGEVYLVRLPVHPRMMEMEQSLMPAFEENIQEAINKSSGYFDMTVFNDDYTYTDGNHIGKKSDIKVTEKIANWIKEQREKK